MTEAEAKEYMENEIRCIQRASYCDRDCAKCNLVKEEKPLLKAFGMAINALEKQIAKKPVCKEMPYSEEVGFNDELHCPTCGAYVGYFTEGMGEPEQMKYCTDCGQKLDSEV